MSKELNKALVNVIAFLGGDAEKLISFCGLEPVNNWRVWTDNSGNELHITEDKKIELKKSKVINFKTYDLYQRAHPSKIAKTSKWALLAKGTLQNEDCMFIWFISHDDKLRLLSFVSDRCKNKSPLTSGINTLMYIIKNMSSSSLQDVPIDVVEPPIKCKITQAFSMPWPPPNDPNNVIANILNDVLS